MRQFNDIKQCKQTESMQQSSGTLYVVATPIGNMHDISLRALDILASVDWIAAEHVDLTRHLLSHHGIKTSLITLHQHNEHLAVEKIANLLANNQDVALVTDAGTPCISDPGTMLVQAMRISGYRVVPIPGANAAICALSVSGIRSTSFLFYGFLPTKSGERRRCLTSFTSLPPYTLIFYEAPHRIVECIRDMIAIFGSHRQITLARELTKVFETLHTDDLENTLQWLLLDENQQKGEFVVLLPPYLEKNESTLSKDAQHTIQILMKELPLKQAVQLATSITGEKKKNLYAYALTIKSN